MNLRAGLLILLALNGMLQLHAQERKNALTIGSGISLPYSDFARKDFGTDAGFASAGANLELDYMRNSSRIFGLCGHLGYANIFINTGAIASGYNQTLGNRGETTVTAGNYQFLMATAGFCTRFPEFLKTQIILRVQAGYALCIHPQIHAENDYWGILNDIQPDTDFQLVGNLGLGINHKLTEKLGIHVSYSLKACLPFFEYADERILNGFHLPVRYQDINTGIIIYF